MSEKAEVFGDQPSYRRVIATSDVSKNTDFGRGVRPLDHAKWELRREGIVLTGTYAKLTQNAAMHTDLSGTVLVTASLRKPAPLTHCGVSVYQLATPKLPNTPSGKAAANCSEKPSRKCTSCSWIGH